MSTTVKAGVNNSLVGFLRRKFYEDKIEPELRGMYNLTLRDFYLSIQCAYQWTDALKVTGSINIIGGPWETSLLGFYSDNSFASLQLRYSF